MSLPYSFMPSSGYRPSTTGSVHQALFHWLRSRIREYGRARGLDVVQLCP